MGRICIPRVKTAIWVLVVVGLIVNIVSCYHAKQKSESCALVDAIKHYTAESFDNFKYCIRPMFAADRAMAIKFWRREVRKLISQCSDAIEKYEYASNELKSSVQNFVLTLERMESGLSNWHSDNREQLRQGVQMVDKGYEAFSKAAERFDCFVERIAYCDEYR